MPRRRRVWTGHHATAKFGHCAQSPSRPDAVSDLSPNIWSGLDGDEHSGTLSTVMAGARRQRRSPRSCSRVAGHVHRHVHVHDARDVRDRGGHLPPQIAVVDRPLTKRWRERPCRVRGTQGARLPGSLTPSFVRCAHRNHRSRAAENAARCTASRLVIARGHKHLSECRSSRLSADPRTSMLRALRSPGDNPRIEGRPRGRPRLLRFHATPTSDARWQYCRVRRTNSTRPLPR